MRSFALCLLSASALWLLTPPAGATELPPSSTFTLEHFYRWVLAHPASALPSAKERAELHSLLSPQLLGLLKDAEQTQARCVKAARKGEKPLILEGDLFVGHEEGATEVAYGPSTSIDKGAVITTMNLFSVDKRFPKGTMFRTVAWTDKVLLRQEGQAMWLVHDILFEESRSLVSALQAYIAEGATSCVVAKR